jgi:hypothetical protein
VTLRGAWAVVTAALLLPAGVLGATVQGTVKNATTGKPGAGVEVVLIQLQGGMTPVLNAKSDAQGHFTFDYPAIGAQPMLVRAIYKGVNFHQPLPPGRTDIEVDVFEPSRDPKTVSVDTHFVIFQPNGGTLVVGEEYSLKNSSQPPLAYYDDKGNFDFALPEGATLKQVAAQGPSGMPVVQSPIDKGKNKYSVAYAFRPGDNGVRYSYEMPYSGDAATVKLPTVYPGARLVIVAPPTVKISGDGLQAGAQEQGMNIYDHGTGKANALVTVNVSGTAPPPSEAAETQSDPAAQGRDAQQGSATQGVSIQVAPGRLDGLKLPIILVLVVGFAGFAFLLARKPVLAVAGGPSLGAADRSTAAVSAATVTPTKAVPSETQSLAAVDAAVGSSLDALKDTLFRLELRRQAGTISEEEYATERARAEKVLRDLVRG